MTPVVCIDFGNSYTKVGVRWDDNHPSQLVEDRSLVFDDELYVCVPTIAAVVRRDSGDRWFLGTDAMRLRDGTAGLHIFRNWKPQFFQSLEDGVEPEVDPSTEFRLADGDWERAKEEFGLSDAQRIQFESMRRASEVDREIDEVAERYFRWLRGVVEPALREYGPGFQDQYVTRITLPAFGAQTRAEQRLVGLLERAGWRAAAAAPCVSEPVGNALGIFTDGRNAVWTPRNAVGARPHMGDMLAGTHLFKVARARFHNKFAQKMYWTLIVDLGGYTLDFAMLGFDVTQLDLPHGIHNGQRRFATHSESLGVAALDGQVAAVLGEGSREGFDQVLHTVDQQRLEALHRTIYQRGRPYDMGQGRQVGGVTTEAEAIRACIGRFADEAANLTSKFIEMGQYKRIDALVLTGGGMNIPQVRDAIRERLTHISHFKQAYVAATSDEALDEVYERLEPKYVRGATALGGSTVYFDYKRRKVV